MLILFVCRNKEMNKSQYSVMFVTIIVTRMLMVAYASVQQHENNAISDSVTSSRNSLINYSLSGKELKVVIGHFGEVLVNHIW